MTTYPLPKRCWINQPSTLQPLHKLHGTNVMVLGGPEWNGMVQIYFLSGDVISQLCDPLALSSGWRAV